MPDQPGNSFGSALLGGSIASSSPLLLVVFIVAMLSVFGSTSGTPSAPEAAGGAESPPASGASEALPEWGTESDIIATLSPLWHFAANAPADDARGRAAEGRPAGAEQVKALLGRLMPGLEGPHGGREPAEGLDALLEMVKDRRPVIRTVIATLPDPVEAQAGYEFDMGLEAIQRAIESEGYMGNRIENPWQPTSAGDDTKAAPHHYRRRPACLLFQRELNEPARARQPWLYLLLVVGESPTWGIHEGAMRTSLEIARLMEEVSRPIGPDAGDAGDADQAPRPTLRILGPSYSGTATSLGRALSTWLDEHLEWDAWVCSGSATSVDKPTFEALATPEGAGRDGPTVAYHSTVLPDELALAELLRYLADPDLGASRPGGPRDPLPSRTVMLVEGGTQYGNRFFRYLYEDLGRLMDEHRVTFIPFPRRIAQIRGIPELTEGFDLKLETTGLAPVPLAEQETAPPYFAPFDPPVTGATDSLILTNILATIANEQARYVGILASEVRNVIFLVQLIQQYCPDVQLFVLNNDMLYTYADFSPKFHGTIVASSYPLDSRAQRWSFPWKGQEMRRMFASEQDIGRYNAFLVLHDGQWHPRGRLRDGRESTAYRKRIMLKPDSLEDLLLYGPPFLEEYPDNPALGASREELRPNLWINIVGRDNVWPVRAIDPRDIRLRVADHFREIKAESTTEGPPVGLAGGDASRALSPTEVNDLRSALKANGDELERFRATLKGLRPFALTPGPGEDQGRGPVRRLGLQPVRRTGLQPVVVTLVPEGVHGAWLRHAVAVARTARLMEAQANPPEELAALLDQAPDDAAEPGASGSLEIPWNEFESFWRGSRRRLRELDRAFRSLIDCDPKPEDREAIRSIREGLDDAMARLDAVVDPSFREALNWLPLARASLDIAEGVDPIDGAMSRDPGTWGHSSAEAFAKDVRSIARRARALSETLADLAHSSMWTWWVAGRLDPPEVRDRPAGRSAGGAGERSFDELWITWKGQLEVFDKTIRGALLPEDPTDAGPAGARRWVQGLEARVAAARTRLDPDSEDRGPLAGLMPRLALVSHRERQVREAEALVPAAPDTEPDRARSFVEAIPTSYLVRLLLILAASPLLWWFARRSLGVRASPPPLGDGGAGNAFDDAAASRTLCVLALVLIATLVGITYVGPALVLTIWPPAPQGRAWGLMLFLLVLSWGFLASMLALGWRLLRAGFEASRGGLAYRDAYRLCLVWAGLGLALNVARLLRVSLPPGPRAEGLTAALVLGGLLAALAAGVAMLVREERPASRWREVSSWRRAGASGLAVVLPMALIGLLWRDWPGAASGRDELLRAARVVHLGSGVSPLPTMMLLGVVVGLWCVFRVLYLNDRRPIDAQLDGPFREPPGPTAPGLRRVNREFRKLRETAIRTAPTSLGDWAVAATPIALITVVYVLFYGFPYVRGLSDSLPGRLTPTVEGRAFDMLFHAAHWAFLVLYVLTIMHLWRLWRRLKRVFVALGALPIERAVEQLPTPVSELFGRFLKATPGNRRTGLAGMRERALLRQYMRILAGRFEGNYRGYQVTLTHTPVGLNGPRRPPKQVVLADVEGQLHIEVTDNFGRVVPTADDRAPSGRVEQIDALRNRLAPLWPLPRLSRTQADEVLADVKALVERPLPDRLPRTPVVKYLRKQGARRFGSPEQCEEALERLHAAAEDVIEGRDLLICRDDPIPEHGKNLVAVARVAPEHQPGASDRNGRHATDADRETLRFRVFDRDGRRLVDATESPGSDGDEADRETLTLRAFDSDDPRSDPVEVSVPIRDREELDALKARLRPLWDGQEPSRDDRQWIVPAITSLLGPDAIDPQATEDAQAGRLGAACLPFVVPEWERRMPDDAFGEPGEARPAPDGTMRAPAVREIADIEEDARVQDGTTITRIRREIRRTTAPQDQGADRDGRAWLALAEEFALVQIVFALKRYAPLVRKPAMFLILAPVFMLFAATMYPFQPQRLIAMILWSLVLVGVALTAWVFMQIDRDPFVSRVSKTTPNAVNFNPSFITTLLPMVIPIAGLILTAFPDVAFWLRGLLEPLGRAIK